MTNEIVSINAVAVNCSHKPGIILVPIKPICEALQIDAQAQYKAIKDHPVYGSAGVLNTFNWSRRKTI